MPSHCLRQNSLFQIASKSDQIFNILSVSHPSDILMNDGPFIQVRRCIMRRRANQLHPTRMRLMVRPTTRESRQERMMNIDYRPLERIKKLSRKDLHIPREHHEIDV